ncbi:DNA polymerase III subunit delta' [Sulfitobacter donghicola]|uniref:DNA polymerase III subunit delta n=1 Tax=Sulfitobacter donghicola DSW-25 = KCTC 12864 = JCM 14565 TaxID=1300350 RepID=A0A073IH10_9RHOB|nr:DNA polymerase III subunit delta' [Sulfitobacter donghicola]KEJ89608.1 DNA polymerase III subunit delta' [Sulfitobacter donghicola DSW-25 = KCTC 12864 = JCM 14565]KIN69446.1 DNA polymerase III subunit delta' [Sulfitobacter donghicola DSW-25 = KCTC 12864 = JCM 14565]
MSDETPPQPERLEGAPHPRDTLNLIGQDAAQEAFLDAFNTGRLHHAWMLTGPRGIGKATLAWRIARFLLATPEANDGGMFGDSLPPPTNLDIPADHPVTHRIAAGAEPSVHLVRLGGKGSTDSDRIKNFADKKYSSVIRVDEIRELSSFIHMSAADGGRRVVIVDDADLMNPNASNALLKMLEEPPARTYFLLISHQPSALLPTIKSRCRTLNLHTLNPEDVSAAMAQADVQAANAHALAALSGGSVGGAMRLSLLGGAALYAELVGIMGTLPHMDRGRALKLAEMAAARGGEAKRDLLFSLIDLLLSRMARAGATGTPPAYEACVGETQTLMRLAPNPHQARVWADLAAEIGTRARHGIAVNLDPAALVLDTFIKMAKAAPR